MIPGLSPTIRERYFLENARLYYDRNHLESSGLLVVFDMGSTYTYLMTPAFRNVLQEASSDFHRRCFKSRSFYSSKLYPYLPVFCLQVDRGLQGEFVRAPDDPTLPHCWKLNGHRHFSDIVAYAKILLRPISFGFADGKVYVIPPESYLIQSVRNPFHSVFFPPHAYRTKFWIYKVHSFAVTPEPGKPLPRTTRRRVAKF